MAGAQRDWVGSKFGNRARAGIAVRCDAMRCDDTGVALQRLRCAALAVQFSGDVWAGGLTEAWSADDSGHVLVVRIEAAL